MPGFSATKSVGKTLARRSYERRRITSQIAKGARICWRGSARDQPQRYHLSCSPSREIEIAFDPYVNLRSPHNRYSPYGQTDRWRENIGFDLPLDTQRATLPWENGDKAFVLLKPQQDEVKYCVAPPQVTIV